MRTGEGLRVTPHRLVRAAAVCAVVAGVLFVAVQIRHPQVDLAFVTTPEYRVRESVKIVLTVLTIVGVSGVYLRQVRRIGVLGLVGYGLFSVAYLGIMSVQVIGVVVLPSLAVSTPGYVSDVLAVANGGTAAGDIGGFQTLNLAVGGCYLTGGLLLGVALFRANVLARWASALLAVGTLASIGTRLLPQVNERVFAIPTGIALIGLGWSLWRSPGDPVAAPGSASAGAVPAAAGAP